SESEVDRVGGTAHVVEDQLDLGRRNDPSNFLLHPAEYGLRALEAHARGSSNMQPELAGGDLREEVAAHEWEDRDGRGYHESGDDECGLARGEEALEYRGVAGAHGYVAVVEALVHAPKPASLVRSLGNAGFGVHLVLLVPQEKRRHHGHERSGQKV